MERNPDGFRISDVRPDTGWAFLHWDDSNLPASDFTPQTELDGVLSNTGVHDWGASSDAGNNRLVNTWSFGQLAIDSFPLILSYNCDYDGDGITNSVDLDDDNDGITDSLEHGGVLPVGDHDGDTIGNFQDADYVHPLYGAFRDSNGDGVNDLFDADGDGIPNFRDVDSDGDGLLDAFEANGGVSPAALNDSTGRITGAVGANGLPDAIETGSESGVSTYALTDTDSDNRPDFRDQDSDNDGLRDNIEVYATGAHVATMPMGTVWTMPTTATNRAAYQRPWTWTPSIRKPTASRTTSTPIPMATPIPIGTRALTTTATAIPTTTTSHAHRPTKAARATRANTRKRIWTSTARSIGWTARLVPASRTSSAKDPAGSTTATPTVGSICSIPTTAAVLLPCRTSTASTAQTSGITERAFHYR